MGRYIFSPADVDRTMSNPLRTCIEKIGECQTGRGSHLAKGRRYLKSVLTESGVSCSMISIKRTIEVCKRYLKEDIGTYGIEVYYFHKYNCAKILEMAIKIIKDRNIALPKNFYDDRMNALLWIYNNDNNYMGQEEAAERIYTELEKVIACFQSN